MNRFGLAATTLGSFRLNGATQRRKRSPKRHKRNIFCCFCCFCGAVISESIRIYHKETMKDLQTSLKTLKTIAKNIKNVAVALLVIVPY